MQKLKLKESFERGWLGVLVIGLLTGALLYQSWGSNHPGGRPPPQLKVGDKLPTVKLATLQGRDVDVNWQSREKATILYYFRPDCVWCARNMAAFKALMSAAADGYSVVGISSTTEGVNEYLKSNGLSMEVYAATDPDTIVKLKVTGTPETIVLSPGGIIEALWRGAYHGKNKQQIEARFGIRLPEIQITDAAQQF